MNLPKHLQEYAAELEEYEQSLEAQATGGESNDQPTDQAPTAEAEDAAPVEQEAQPPVDQDTASAQDTSLPPEPAKPPKWDDEEELWEHKYRRLQGKYDAEVPRLHAELKEVTAKLQQLETELAKKPEPEPEAQPQSSITQEDIDAFGEDLVDLQKRVANDMLKRFEGELAKLRSENDELRQTLQQTGSQIGAMSFEQQLHQLVPDFATVNQDKRWIEWLNEFEPMIQGPRRNVVQDAYSRGDAQAVKGYIDIWRQTIQDKPASNAARQQELKKQVQPTRAHSPTPTDRGGQKVYSDKDARNIFARIQKLVSKGEYAEAEKLESEISAAYAEGRVTP